MMKFSIHMLIWMTALAAQEKSNIKLVEKPWLLKQNHKVITYDDENNLILNVDVQPILDEFDNIMGIIKITLEEISSNMRMEDINILVESEGVKLSNDDLEKFLNTTMGSIHRHLTTILVGVEEDRERFLSFISINFEKNRNEIDQAKLHEEIVRITRVRKKALQQELVKMMHMHSNMSGEGVSKLTKERSERSVRVGKLMSSNLAYLMGKVTNQIGISGIENGWEVNTYEGTAEQTNILNSYEFESHLAHSINITNKYLRKTAKISRDLILAMYALAKKEVEVQIQEEDQNIINRYTINLIAIQGALFELTDLIDEMMATSQQNQLSVSLFGDQEMVSYLEDLKNQTSYESIVKEDNLFLLYKIFPIQVTMKDMVIQYKLSIPLVKKGRDVRSFEKIKIMNNYFFNEGEWVQMVSEFESVIAYQNESGHYYKMSNCVVSDQVTLCKPMIYEYSLCLNELLNKNELNKDCRLRRVGKKQFMYEVQAGEYMIGFERPSKIEIRCYFEEKEEHWRIHTRWEQQTFEVESNPYILTLPGNCKAEFNKNIIHTKFETERVISKRWEHIEVLDIGNVSIASDFVINLDIINQTKGIWDNLNHIFYKFKPDGTKRKILIKSIIYEYLTIVQTVFLVGILILILVGIMRKCGNQAKEKLITVRPINEVKLEFGNEDKEEEV